MTALCNRSQYLYFPNGMGKSEKFGCFPCPDHNSWKNWEWDPKPGDFNSSVENITRSSRTSSLINVGITRISEFAYKGEYKTKEFLMTLIENNDSLMSSPL